MRPEQRDQAFLWDMLQAACEASSLCTGMRYEVVAADRRTLLALERLLELVGESARRVSPTYQLAHPEIPWRKLVGMRNVLAHEYGHIDHRRLYLAATSDAAELSRILKALLETRDGA